LVKEGTQRPGTKPVEKKTEVGENRDSYSLTEKQGQWVAWGKKRAKQSPRKIDIRGVNAKKTNPRSIIRKNEKKRKIPGPQTDKNQQSIRLARTFQTIGEAAIKAREEAARQRQTKKNLDCFEVT